MIIITLIHKVLSIVGVTHYIVLMLHPIQVLVLQVAT